MYINLNTIYDMLPVGACLIFCTYVRYDKQVSQATVGADPRVAQKLA